MKAADLGQVVKARRDELRAVYLNSTLPKAYPTIGAALKGRIKSTGIINLMICIDGLMGIVFFIVEMRLDKPAH